MNKHKNNSERQKDATFFLPSIFCSLIEFPHMYIQSQLCGILYLNGIQLDWDRQWIQVESFNTKEQVTITKIKTKIFVYRRKLDAENKMYETEEKK